MSYLALVLLGSILSIAPVCEGEMACPWMNKATAAGLLNVNDSPEAQDIVVESTPCSFTYNNGRAAYTLQITVNQIKDRNATAAPYEAACTSEKIQLLAIGNEASLCDSDRRRTLGEQVIGRVRDEMFLISISCSANSDSSMGRMQLREKATLAAEQVVGNMF